MLGRLLDSKREKIRFKISCVTKLEPRAFFLVLLVAFLSSCAAPVPKWLVEMEGQVGSVTYEELVKGGGEPLSSSKENGQIVAVWTMEEVVRPNWSIHTYTRTVVCEKYSNKAKMWFNSQRVLTKIEPIPGEKGQKLGQANIPLITNIKVSKNPYYNFNYDDIRRMCMLDISCSRIATDRCKMLDKSKRGKPSN
jgi:hypothetical protein